MVWIHCFLFVKINIIYDRILNVYLCFNQVCCKKNGNQYIYIGYKHLYINVFWAMKHGDQFLSLGLYCLSIPDSINTSRDQQNCPGD